MALPGSGGIQLPTLVQRVTVDGTGVLRGAGTVEAGSQRMKRALTAVKLAVAATAAASLKLAEDYDAAFAKIRGLVGIAADEVQAMRDATLDLAGETAQRPKALADALFFITSAGFSGAEAMDVLAQSARAATAGLGDTAVIADAVTSAVNAYRASGLDASRATDILTAAVREGKLEASSLAPVLGRLLPTASSLGVAFEDVAGILAVMSRTGLDAAEASTSLNAILSLISRSAGPAAERALQSAGLSMDQLRELAAQPGGLIEVMRTLDVAFGDNTEALSAIIPNIRAFRGFMNVLAQDGAQVDKVMRGVAESTGATDAAFAAVAETSGFQLQRAFAEIQSLMIRVGDLLAPFAAEFAKFLSGIAVEMQDVFVDLYSVFRQLLPTLRSVLDLALDAFRPLIDAFARLMPLLVPVLDALGVAFASALRALAPAIRTVAEAAVELAVAFGDAVANAIYGLTPALTAFAEVIAAMSPLLRVAASAVSALVDVFGPFAVGLLLATKAVVPFAQWIIALPAHFATMRASVAATTASIRGFAAAHPYLMALAAAVTVAVGVFGKMRDEQREAEARINSLTDAILRDTEALSGNADAVRRVINEWATSELDDSQIRALADAGVTLAQVTDAIAQQGDALDIVGDKFADMQTLIANTARQMQTDADKLAEALGVSSEQVVELARAMEDQRAGFDQFLALAGKAPAVAEEWARANGVATNSLVQFTLELAKTGQLTPEVQDTILALAETQRAAAEKVDAHRRVQADLGDATRKTAQLLADYGDELEALGASERLIVDAINGDITARERLDDLLYSNALQSGDLAARLSELYGIVDEGSAANDEFAVNLQSVRSELESSGAAAETATGKVGAYGGEIAQQKQQIEDAAAANANLAEGLTDVGMTADEAEESVKTFADALAKVLGTAATVEQALLDWNDALATLRDTASQTGVSIDLTTESGREFVGQLLELIDSSREAAIAQYEHTLTTQGVEAAVREATNTFRMLITATLNEAEAMGLAGREALLYTARLLGIPEERFTEIDSTADIASLAVVALQQHLNRLPQYRQIDIDANTEPARTKIDQLIAEVERYLRRGFRIPFYPIPSNHFGGVVVGPENTEVPQILLAGEGVLRVGTVKQIAAHVHNPQALPVPVQRQIVTDLFKRLPRFAAGGIVRGPVLDGEVVPILAHVGEGVLTRETVEGLARDLFGRIPTTSPTTPTPTAVGEYHRHYHVQVTALRAEIDEQSLMQALRRMEILHA